MRIAALVPYQVDYCAGQRFRIEMWARHLRPRGIDISFLPFATPSLTDVLYQPGRMLDKAGAMLRCYVEQVGRVLAAKRPDLVFIYREAALIGPAFIEQLTRRWRAPIVYDLDEPLFVPYVSPKNGVLNKLKFFSKIDTLLGLSDRVLAVNRAIGDYAAAHARAVSIVPMAVDTDRYRAPSSATANGGPGDGTLRIGWVGTRTSQPNLEVIAEPLARLGRTHGAKLRVIADEPMTLPGVDLEFLPWAYDREVAQLSECQIAVVPVRPDTWSPWKFYFKLIQFMSLGLPVVASPIGSNNEIVSDGENGLLANDADAWYERLRALAEDAALRKRLGQAGRATAEGGFSLAGQIDQLEGIFRSAREEHRS